MAFAIPLEGWTPPPRYGTLGATPWTQAQIEESTIGPTGPWTVLDTQALSPLDADPANPQARNLSVLTANPTGWYRITWLDAGGNESPSAPTYSDQSSYQNVGVNFGTLVSRLIAGSGLAPEEAQARINQAHRRMVVEGEALKSKVSFGPTVVGQTDYELDPDVAQLLSLRVNGYGYERKGLDELDDLTANDAHVVGRYRGFFAPNFSTAGNPEVMIYPAPTVAGQTIEGRAIMLPPDLVNDSDYPSLPADFHEDLVEAALATVLLRDDERLSDAFALEDRFKQRILELRGRMTRRVGSGPARIKLTR